MGTVIFIIVVLALIGIGVAVAVARQRAVRIDTKTGHVIVGGQRIPLAGARAEVVVDRSGAFGRTARSTIVVTGANGSQAVYAIGGEHGNKGKTSRQDADRYRTLAARINTLGARRPAVQAH